MLLHVGEAACKLGPSGAGGVCGMCVHTHTVLAVSGLRNNILAKPLEASFVAINKKTPKQDRFSF